MTWVKGEVAGSGARCWLRGRKAVARWVRAGCRSGGKALAGGEGGVTAVAYERRSRPVAAGGASGGGGGEGGGGCDGLEAAANVRRGVGERGKAMAEVVCSVRAGAGERESRRRGGSRRWRRGGAETRRIGRRMATVESDGRYFAHKSLDRDTRIGTPLNPRNSPHLSSLSQHRHPRTMVWRTMLVTVSTSFLLGPCPAAAARAAQLTRVRRDNVYPLDCRPQRSLAIARHDRGHQPLHQILLPAGVGSKWTGVGVYRRRACSAAQCWRPVHQGVPRKQRGGSVRRRKSWYVFHPQRLAHV